jgi:hypothetical protein
MARRKKSYLKDDGNEYRVCAGPCKGEYILSKDNFRPVVNQHGKPYFDSYCYKCKAAYLSKYRAKNRQDVNMKEYNRMKRKVTAIQDEMTAWKPLFDFARAHPLSQGFKTPQEFILATLKTTYDNGRQKTG